MSSKQDLLLYWKAPTGWSIFINGSQEVVLFHMENGVEQKIRFSRDTNIKSIEKVMKTIGFKKKRGIVV